MSEYRAYTVDKNNHFVSHRAFVCDSAEDAIPWTKQQLDGHPIELWSGARFVLRIEQKSD